MAWPIVCTLLSSTAPHTDSSLLPSSTTTKAELWEHIHSRLAARTSANFVTQETVLGRDVHSHPGHIACGGATRNEVVAPVFAGDGERIVGVLDVDCLKEGGFEDVDRLGVERVAKLLGEGCDW